jgi:prepilin-type N-terminal cleavage/methylation domain-containing protein
MNRDEAGFTLLEILVALVLLGLFVTALAGVLRFALNAEGRLEHTATMSDNDIRTRIFLRDYLGAADPVWIPDPDFPHVAFTGAATTMRFIAPTPGSLGGFGLAQFELRIETSGKGYRLTSRATDTSGHQPDSLYTVLSRQIGPISFDYYGAPASGIGLAWQSTWQNRSTIPELIAIKGLDEHSVTKTGSSPDFIVHTALNAGVGCTLDVNTMRCAGR